MEHKIIIYQLKAPWCPLQPTSRCREKKTCDGCVFESSPAMAMSWKGTLI